MIDILLNTTFFMLPVAGATLLLIKVLFEYIFHLDIKRESNTTSRSAGIRIVIASIAAVLGALLCFFSIWFQQAAENPVAKIVEARLQGPHLQSNGYHPGTVAGLPHLDSSVLRGEYPFVWVDFEDADLPLQIQMEAFTPFIPLNAADSGIPGAVIRYKVTNRSDRPARVAVAGSLTNAVGCTGFDEYGFFHTMAENHNEYRDRLSKAETMKELYHLIRDGTDGMFDILSSEYIFPRVCTGKIW